LFAPSAARIEEIVGMVGVVGVGVGVLLKLPPQPDQTKKNNAAVTQDNILIFLYTKIPFIYLFIMINMQSLCHCDCI
jgi:ABC-type methionine transport system permease subunit